VLLEEIEELNRKLAGNFQQATCAALGLDYTEGNPAAALQLEITKGFGARHFAEDGSLRTADEMLDEELLGLIRGFSGRSTVHRAAPAPLSPALND
jgi:hypothetical protein